MKLTVKKLRGYDINNSVLGFKLNTDGRKYDQLNIHYDMVGSWRNSIYDGLYGRFNTITMNGKEVYK